MIRTIRRTRLFTMLFLALAGALLGSAALTAPVFAADKAVHPAYLPMLQTGSGQVTPTPTVTASPTVTATPVTRAYFAEIQWRTSSAAIAVDAQGGNHLAYVYYHGLAENVPNSGAYFYCAQNCTDAAQWQGVRLGQEVNEIQLKVTPQGRPRLLMRMRGANNGHAFYYAACDDQCTDPARWSMTHVASNSGTAPIEINDGELPQRYFALDGAGRPRFVYLDQTPSHYGAFYAFCDGGCTDKANWREVRITKDNGGVGQYRDEDYFYPALTFTADGRPRIVADGATMQDEFVLFYLACDVSCDKPENWQSAPIFPRGFGFEFSYDVAINAAGSPRIAYYEGGQLNGEGNRLYYAWCDTACTQVGNWQRSLVGLGVLEGQEPDLELDAAGRPHIAYALYGEGGLGYSTCASACESANGQWTHKVLENRVTLAEDWSAPLPLICSGGLWDGLTPVMVLDGAGAPHIAYDATFYARCHYVGKDKWEPWNEMNLVWRAVRVHLVNGSTTPVTPTPTVTPETPTPTVTSVTPTVTVTATTTPTPTVTATVTPTPPPLPRLGTGLFPDTAWQTGSSDIAVDSAGGKHMAYVYTEAIFGPDPDGSANPTTAVYRSCQTGCESAQNWSSVALGEAVSEVQLVLTADGKPRLLLLQRAETNAGHADRYVYAECNQNCGANAGWQRATLVTVPNDLSWRWLDDPADMMDRAREGRARRYFALDPTGRPRFVYYHYNADVDPDGAGAYYAACDGSCTTPGNWTHTRITEVTDWSGTLEWEVLEEPVLAFTPDGAPRLLAAMLPLGILRFPGLFYIACDAQCDDVTNWRKVQVGNGEDASGVWDLALDANGKPYLALASLWGNDFRYGWCDDDCQETIGWQFASGPEIRVRHLDLELDGQGRPRIVYVSDSYDANGDFPSGLFYLRCTDACRSDAAQWTEVRVEVSDHVRIDWPKSLPPACAQGNWYHFPPTVASGPDGSPHVVTDVSYIGPCQYDAATKSWKPGENFTYSTVWRAARLVVFPQ